MYSIRCFFVQPSWVPATVGLSRDITKPQEHVLQLTPLYFLSLFCKIIVLINCSASNTVVNYELPQGWSGMVRVFRNWLCLLRDEMLWKFWELPFWRTSNGTCSCTTGEIIVLISLAVSHHSKYWWQLCCSHCRWRDHFPRRRRFNLLRCFCCW